MFDASAEFYDLIYTSMKDYAAEAAGVAEIIRAVRPEARTALDVGCGTGEHARLLATHGFDVDGLDLDAGLLAHARTKQSKAWFFEADMCDFDLGRTYDVILCLFSAIGYAVTLPRVTEAFRAFRRHLAPGGVVLVEPWFAPGVLRTGAGRERTAATPDGSVRRTSSTSIDAGVSHLEFVYRIESAGGVREVREHHELGLFTEPEMRTAFAEAGFTVDFDPEGLTGRGLYIAEPRPH